MKQNLGASSHIITAHAIYFLIIANQFVFNSNNSVGTETKKKKTQTSILLIGLFERTCSMAFTVLLDDGSVTNKVRTKN